MKLIQTTFILLLTTIVFAQITDNGSSATTTQVTASTPAAEVLPPLLTEKPYIIPNDNCGEYLIPPN